MVKQIGLVMLALFGFVKVGYSRQCHRCSGDLQSCNIEMAATDTCAKGVTDCVSMVLNSDDSGMHFFYGCGNPMDCKAARSSCAEVMKQNPAISCDTTCCSSDRCAKPYDKDYKPLQCYECTSMKDCEMAKVKPCSQDQDNCFKLSTDVTHKGPNLMLKTYSKGCATSEQCKKENMGKNVFYSTCTSGDESCHMSCCKGDMCNAGSNVVVSAFTLLACAVLAVVRL